MTSLPMPSPAITEILYVFAMYESAFRLSFYVFCCGKATKVITHAAPAAARPAVAGVAIPQPRPAVTLWTTRAAQTPATIVTSAPDDEVRGTYSPARIGTKSDTPTSV